MTELRVRARILTPSGLLALVGIIVCTALFEVLGQVPVVQNENRARQNSAESKGLVQRVSELEGNISALSEAHTELQSRLAAIQDESLPPIGSIVASFLPYDNMPEGFRRRWAPCDGRNGTPDLRGVFLRGLNQFEKGKLRADRDVKGDPDGDSRSVGSWQSDELKSHSHVFPGELKTDGRGGKAQSIVVDENAPRVDGNLLVPFGGIESRPRNVAVFYFARVK